VSDELDSVLSNLRDVIQNEAKDPQLHFQRLALQNSAERRLLILIFAAKLPKLAGTRHIPF
jgi:hypothetical protein